LNGPLGSRAYIAWPATTGTYGITVSSIDFDSAASSIAGTSSSAATNIVIAVAVCRRIAPSPNPSSPIATG
jgi:hypothetical protein